MIIHTDREIAAIRFDNGECIPLEGAFTYADADARYLWPAYVVWADGFESFAKGWRRPIDRDDPHSHWVLCRIGAGAYGDMLIATA